MIVRQLSFRTGPTSWSLWLCIVLQGQSRLPPISSPRSLSFVKLVNQREVSDPLLLPFLDHPGGPTGTPPRFNLEGRCNRAGQIYHLHDLLGSRSRDRCFDLEGERVSYDREDWRREELVCVLSL